MRERRDVVVIGAGLLGLAAARRLADLGRDVMVLDQAEVGHPAGGSKGSCRIFRLGYEDAEYVTLARRARMLWTELESLAGERLLHPVPQLTLGHQMRTVLDGLNQAGASCELLSAEEAAGRFPGVVTGGQVLLEHDSAVIAADRALAVLTAAVPDIRTGIRVTGLADDGRRVRVSTAAGEIDAGGVIVCAGPWTGGLLASAGISVPGSATQEQVAYLAPVGSEPALAMPIFIYYGDEIPYGLPVPGSPLYKIGLHHDGTPVDPEQQDQAADEALGRRIELAARRFLPAFDPRPVAVERCVYDNSPDTDFIVDRIGNVVIGSGTSGHGFKFGPLFGEWLAALAVRQYPQARPGRADQAGRGDRAGGAGPRLPPAKFALGRFSSGGYGNSPRC